MEKCEFLTHDGQTCHFEAKTPVEMLRHINGEHGHMEATEYLHEHNYR